MIFYKNFFKQFLASFPQQIIYNKSFDLKIYYLILLKLQGHHLLWGLIPITKTKFL